MSEDEYYDAIRSLLHQRQFLGTWFDSKGNTHSVPLARDLSPEARAAVVQRIKRMLAETA